MTRGVLVVAVLLATVLPGSQARAQGSVRVPGEIALEDARIRLGRIAIFEGVPSALESELTELSLGPAADPAQVRVLGGAALRARVHAIAPELTLHIPDQVRITRLHREIAPEWVRKRVEAALEARKPWHDAKVRVSGWSLPQRFAVPANATGLRVAFGPEEDFQGRVSARLEFFDPKTPERAEVARSAAFEVELQVPVLVAARNLRRGERVDASAFRKASMDPRRIPRDALPGADLVTGQPLRVNVQSGVPLLLSYFDTPEVVRRGDPIEVSAGAPGLEIRIDARALEGGTLGEMIRAENPSSKKSFVVELTGPGTALLVRPGSRR